MGGLPRLLGLQNGRIALTDLCEDEECKFAVAPGFVDLQINGYGGYDINAQPLGEDTLSHMIRSIWREGVTTCFPTVITNGPEAILATMKTIAKSCDRDQVVEDGIGGIHLEGPFISPEDGPRGAHARKFVRPPDWEMFCRWQEASGGRIRLITLSPEWPGSEAFISRCTESGVRVSIGHTAATSEQIGGAVKAGARLSTHLGNAAHLMLPRHPNYIWEQLAQNELWATMIADGFHLPDQVLRVVMTVKKHRAMMVSDAVALCGMPAGEYATPVGGKVVLTSEGRLHLKENEKLLAGSARMLLHGVDYLSNHQLANHEDAWHMASELPAKFMGMEVAAGMVLGAPADLVVFDRVDGRTVIEATYKSGRCVYERDRSSGG
jgi:N-acetylglucosamine-6-phosphate deacetylase